MKHIIIDAAHNGVRIRCFCSSKRVMVENLPISSPLIKSLSVWMQKYEEMNNGDCHPYSLIESVENEGINIALNIKNEAPYLNAVYQSDILLVAFFGPL
ncbi:hypothetical protein [Dyadobacter soli]|nr:hypothetical protein [Dyadobacter soli]